MHCIKVATILVLTLRRFARPSSLRSVDCHGQFEALEDLLWPGPCHSLAGASSMLLRNTLDGFHRTGPYRVAEVIRFRHTSAHQDGRWQDTSRANTRII